MKKVEEHSWGEVCTAFKALVCLFVLWVKVKTVSILYRITNKSVDGVYTIRSSFLGMKASVRFRDVEN